MNQCDGLDMKPENTGKIQVKGRFSKGQSGNPAGKPKGARHQSTLLAERQQFPPG